MLTSKVKRACVLEAVTSGALISKQQGIGPERDVGRGVCNSISPHPPPTPTTANDDEELV